MEESVTAFLIMGLSTMVTGTTGSDKTTASAAVSKPVAQHHHLL